MTLHDIAERALLEGVGREVAAEFPKAAGQRGWRVANLEHGWERVPGSQYELEDGETIQTPETVREYWSVDVYGPVPDCHWHRYAGGPWLTSFTTRSDITGTLWSPTPEGLVLMARQFVEQAGLDGLTPTLKPNRTPPRRFAAPT